MSGAPRHAGPSGWEPIAEHETPGFRWSVLADPEGDEFCVSD